MAYDPDVVICQKAFLPHWTKEGGIYAVRFRLADSLPQGKLEQWKEERKELVENIAARNGKPTQEEQRRLDILFSEKIEGFLDAGHGACWLRRDDIAKIVAEALRFFDNKWYRLLAWTIMPNHVHVVVQPIAEKSLFEICASWKRFTSRVANKVLQRSGPFWQSESFDHLIRNQESLEKWVEYTWRNPEVAGLLGWKWRWRIDS